MGFDFAKLEDLSKKKKARSKVLEAVCLGCGGSGKSTLAGTLPGKILYLYGEGERHGRINAQSRSKSEIVDISLDTYNNPEQDADVAITTSLEILGDIDGLVKAGFTAVVVDGLVEYEQIIRASKAFKRLCLTKDGKHNTFEEGNAVKTMLRNLLSALRKVADAGIHYYLTCALDVRALDNTDGSIMEATPRLGTFAVIETVLLQIPDIFMIGEMTNGDKSSRRIQFNGNLEKKAMDGKGGVKRFLNFTPRLCGVFTPPSNMPADLSKVIALKERGDSKKEAEVKE